MTVGDVRAAIKDLADDMPLFMNDKYKSECEEILSIEEKIILDMWGERESLDPPTQIKCLVFGI